MKNMDVYPAWPVLLTMMEKGFTSLTISTAIGSIQMHNNPQKAACMLMECLNKAEITEKEFWRFLQDEVMESWRLK